MNLGTTAAFPDPSSRMPHVQPSSTKQQGAQPPEIGLRLPQAHMLGAAPSGMPAAPDSAPQFIAPVGTSSPRSRLCAAACDEDAPVVERMPAGAAGHADGATLLLDQDPDFDQEDKHGSSAQRNDEGKAATDLAMAREHRLPSAQASTSSVAAAVSAMSDMPAHAPRRLSARIFKAVKRNDAQDLKRLLAELRQSGKDGAGEVCRVFKVSRASDGWMVDRQFTPLMAAAYWGYGELAGLLVEAGAQPDQATSSGWTALMFAARKGHTATVRVLLEAGAKVDQAMSDGTTALMLAAQKGHTVTVPALLEAGAKVDQATFDGRTALMIAARKGYTITVQTLIEAGAKLDQPQSNGWTALMLAAQNGYNITVQALLDAGAKVNKVECEGWTALMYAAKRGHAATVLALLSAHANSKAKTTTGATALSLAIQFNRQEVVDLLRRHGADTGKKSKGSFASWFG